MGVSTEYIPTTSSEDDLGFLRALFFFTKRPVVAVRDDTTLAACASFERLTDGLPTEPLMVRSGGLAIALPWDRAASRRAMNDTLAAKAAEELGRRRRRLGPELGRTELRL